jgi:hypothetical protein
VTTGKNIPTTREAPGNVPEGSLAAESARKGGAFAENVGMEQGPQKRSQQTQTQQQQQQGSSRAGTGEGSTAANKTTSAHLESQQTSRNLERGQQTSRISGGGGGGTGEGRVLGATTMQTTPSAATSGGPVENPEGQGAAAPTYVPNQRYRDPGGPHGKNLKEGGFEGSGTEAGPLPEPGSMEDPTRVATRDLKAGMGSQGRDAGPRQTGGVEGKSWYTPLGGDEPA